MKYRDHIVKLKCDSRTFPFLDIGTESFKKCLLSHLMLACVGLEKTASSVLRCFFLTLKWY